MTIDPKNLSSTATLTFSDEFNTLSLRTNGAGTWTTNYWWGAANGSSLTNNGEQEWYIDHRYAPTASVKPWTVSNGILTLTGAPASATIQPHINNYKYTSGMITSYETFTQKYGYFEMRAQLPAGQGLWPAFWLLPANGQWPPEIDIMEVLGNNPSVLYTVTHTNETGSHTSKGEGSPVANTSTGFHTYGVNWQSDYITWYFDGVEVFKTTTPADLHQPMYILANLAVGGYWPGVVDSTTPFPAQMKIDYIRAYADAGTAPAPVAPPAPAAPAAPVAPSAPAAPGGSGRERGTRDDPRDGRDGSDADRGPRAGDATDGRDGSGIDRGGRRTDTLDGRDGSDTSRVALRADTPDGRDGSNGADGNDILTSGDNWEVLTESAGSDVFEFDNLPSNRSRGSDFTAGTDMLELRGYRGTDAVADGYLSFESDGAGSTEIYFDREGAGTAHESPSLMAVLGNADPSGLHMQAEWLLH